MRDLIMRASESNQAAAKSYPVCFCAGRHAFPEYNPIEATPGGVAKVRVAPRWARWRKPCYLRLRATLILSPFSAINNCGLVDYINIDGIKS
jgi:hypothetical protein